MAAVGDRIRARRVALELTQHDVAGPGVSAQYVSKIERGVRRPSVKALRVIAARLDVTPEWLEFGDVVAFPLRRDEAERLVDLLGICIKRSDRVQLADALQERLERLISLTPKSQSKEVRVS